MQETVKKREEMPKKEGALDRALWRGRAYALVKEFLWGGAAYVLGGAPTPFGTTALGLALLCAAPRHLPSILVGLILSAFADLREPLLYIVTYAVAALLRFVFGLMIEDPNARFELPPALRARLSLKGRRKRREEADEDAESTLDAGRDAPAKKGRRVLALRGLRALFTEGLCLRIAVAAICSTAVGVLRLCLGGFRFYDLFALLWMLGLVPLLVTVWSACMEPRHLPKWMLRVSEAAFGAALIYSCNGLLLSGFSLSVILATALVLFATSANGVAIGGGAGVLLGAVQRPLYAPSFLLLSLVFSLMQRGRRAELGGAAGVLAMSVWALYVGGASALLVYLPAGLIGAAAFSLLQRLRGKSSGERERADGAARMQMETRKYKDSTERFRGISEAFSSLSEVFYDLSDRFRRPGVLDLRRICDGAFDEHCRDCRNKTLCWGLEYEETLEEIKRLSSRLHTHGRVGRAQLLPHLEKRCERIDLILELINRRCAELTAEMLRNNRTEIFAMDYEAASTIINDALEEDDGEYRFDEEQARRIGEYLHDAGVSYASVTVYGSRRRRILVRDVCVDGARVTVETMRSDLGEMCGLELSSPVFEVEDGITSMCLSSRQKLCVSGAKYSVSAQEGVCGDSVNLFSNKKDYFYALISDGMGSGSEAAFTSALCSVFLEKMLRAGNRASTSWRMLNNLICSREGDSTRECSSTVDLLELDLITGEASFIKSGASPSFILRAGVAHRVQVGTAPIGIIRSLTMQRAFCSLRPGDTVVMVSDGVLREDDEGVRFAEALGKLSSLSLQELTRELCRRASLEKGHDDCSVIALRIEEPTGKEA